MSDKDELDIASEEAKNYIKEQEIRIKPTKSKKYFKKKNAATFLNGYDLLENQYIVRSNIQKRHGIPLAFLELLLKLAGMKVFTSTDFYNEVPSKIRTKKSLIYLVQEGWCCAVRNPTKPRHTNQLVYCLDTKGKNIVRSYYEMLSGEKPIPETWSVNYKDPLTGNKFNNFYKKFIKAINSSDQKSKEIFYKE
ncbi:MAG: hypothetical protein ACWA5P_01870 [bacterium]